MLNISLNPLKFFILLVYNFLFFCFVLFLEFKHISKDTSTSCSQVILSRVLVSFM